mmetsp:Transcript_13078/g.19621  ORF Transcript_13078/g.19621 Transcript_13078/m.19621 type:complete len:245 (+) Transcript_13078:125-859(+)
MAGKGFAVFCLSLCPLMVMVLCTALAVVGYLADWGTSDIRLSDDVQGRADYGLWTLTPQTQKGPASTYDIDDTLCDQTIQGSNIRKVCNHFGSMRLWTVIALVASVLATVCAIAACAAARSDRASRIVRSLISTITIGLALLASAAAVIALVFAWSMPDVDSTFEQRRSIGWGSMAILLLVLVAFVGALFEVCFCCTSCCCRNQRDSRDEVQSIKTVEHHHHHHNEKEGSESTEASTPRGAENA